MYFKTNSKIVAFITMIAMILTLVTPVFAAQVSEFTDFPTGWSKEAMTHAVENGILNGRTSTTINPKDNLTRAEMATIINRVFGATVKADISHLTDVSRTDWYYDEIAKAVNMRTFQGDSATTMNPDSYITREQVFVAIARALVLSTEDFSSLDKYPDSGDVSDWAKSSAAVLVSKGYVNGYGDTGKFCPKSYITREEFAQVMYNIIKTYYVTSGVHSKTGLDSTLVRTTGVTVKDVTIDGDLIIGDGVGAGDVVIENVIVNGRLLCRGGEGSIRLVNTKVNGGVVVNDVNGTVHFDNYRTESVFNNIILNTPATFKKRVGSSGTAGGGGETYYTVSFHNGATADVFDTVDVKQSIPAENRTLSYVGENLNEIYAGKLDTVGQTYARGNFTDPLYTNLSTTAYPGLGVQYTHTVGKDFVYKKSNGIWDVFTNDTPITGNIDVYYGQKHITAEIDKQILGINPILEVSYDSTSRFFDTFKDGMISAGIMISDNAVKSKVNSKISAAFDKANAKTGMVDSQGNILDKDYGLKIIDVIDYDQINAEINKKIDTMLDVDPNNPASVDELRSVVSFFDIPTLVENIGGRELIEAIGISSIRTMLASDSYKADGIAYIQEKIKGDPSDPDTLDASAEIIEKVLTSDAKDALIDSAAGNNAFIASLLGNPTFKSKILGIVKTERKDLVLEYLGKSSVKNEIIKTIKSDSDFEDKINNITDKTFINTLVDAVKGSQAFKDILTGDSTYKDSIIAEIKETKISEFTDILVNDADVKKEMVGMIGDVDNTDGPKSDLAVKAKTSIMNIINTNDAYAGYRAALQRENMYEAVLYYYVYRTRPPYNVTFNPLTFTRDYVPMIDNIIDQVVDGFVSYDPEDETQTKPDGYDVINDYFDDFIDDTLEDYANGNLDNAASGSADAKIKAIIDAELPGHIESAIKDYIDETKTLDATVSTAIDNVIIDFAKRYVNGDTTLSADIVTVIEDNIVALMINYFNGEGGLANNQDVKNLVESIKSQFVTTVKTTDVSLFKDDIIAFIQDPDNADFVDTFVADKYENILSAVDDAFIMEYLGGLSDDEIDTLVIQYATVDMIVNHIVDMTPDDRHAFAQKIVSFLDSYDPFVEFMNSFKNKDEFFKVNKDNIHFVTAVGEAVYGFDFNEILTILRNKGYGDIIDFLGEDIVEDMFVAAKTDYWAGLEPVINAVKGDNVERQYTTRLSITINVPLILHGIYEDHSDKFVNAVENNPIYDYDHNDSLRKFVNINWFNLAIGYDPSRVNEATGVTGYYFKDYMDYYTSMLDAFILYDQALCFYDRQNYTDAELIEVKKSLTKDFVTFVKKLEELSDNVENGRPIVGSYTLDDLIARVDSLKTVVDSLGGTPVAGYEDTIKSVVDNVKQILTDLGQGDLPNGYTFDDLQTLCDRLNAVIDAMNTGDYESANASFETLINNSISKLASIIDELDTDGTIAGRPLDAIFSKISVINEIYSQYEDQLKDIISAIADMDIDSMDISVSLEKFEDIIFGREEENIFNADTVVNLIGTKITPSTKNVLDTSNGKYIIDKYSKSIKGYTATLERNFY